MSTIFSKIIQREVPAYIIKEDDDFIAFLDVFPLKKGHTLVVPKVEVDNIFDLNNELLNRFFVFVRPIAKAIEASFQCNRCGIAVIGLEVPHAHMHLVPINTANDLNFTQSKLSLTDLEMSEIQKIILTHLH